MNTKDEPEELRQQIDRIDQQLVQLLMERMSCSRKIGIYKKKNRRVIYDPLREEEIIQEKIKLFQEKRFNDPLFVRKLFLLLFEKSREMQE